MTEHTRRTVLEAAGASLLGSTLAGTATAAEPVKTGVSLLEVHVSFDFEDVDDLHTVAADRPVAYGIDPEQGTLEILTMSDRERRALKGTDRLVNFGEIRPSRGSIGGRSIEELPLRTGRGEMDGTYVRSPEGYGLPSFDIDMVPTRALGARRRIKPPADVSVDIRRADDRFVELELPHREIAVEKRIVRDEPADVDPVLDLEPGKVVERTEEEVGIVPYLTVAYHPDLDVVERR